MLTIYVEKIKHRTYTGYIYRSELTTEQAALFPGHNETIDIEGNYFAEIVDDSVNISIEDVLAFCGKSQLILEPDDFNARELALEIYEDGPHNEWFDEDKSDYYYDMGR